MCGHFQPFLVFFRPISTFFTRLTPFQEILRRLVYHTFCHILVHFGLSLVNFQVFIHMLNPFLSLLDIFYHFLVFWPPFRLYNRFIIIYDSTDTLTTRMNPKPIRTQSWFASIRAQWHSFPDDLKTEKYKNGRGKSSGGDRGRPKVPRSPEDRLPRPFLYFSVFRSSGKEKKKKGRKASNRKPKPFFT